MNKIHIVSNRLPISLKFVNNKLTISQSVGGLATGMRSIYKDYGGKWIGWCGIDTEELSQDRITGVEEALKIENCAAVHLSKEDVSLYYEGFCNQTIWPLFHYFPQYIDCNNDFWEAYKNVNRKFADTVLDTIDESDIVWIHDYHLLLVPEMIKSRKPDITVGFFLHIPFPSFEVFRILPWRNELLRGMLGADLLGFHTYDYQRHFFSCVRRMFGLDISFNQIHLEDRILMADAFPMGIDFNRFYNASLENAHKTLSEKSDLQKELDKYLLLKPERKFILSIDRMDYSKGIPNRLRAFDIFLEKYPEYRGNITLIMLAVPSRDKVERYRQLKREVDELIGKINGKYGAANYTPVWYFYRFLPFNNLVELYSTSDVAIVTPVRDGMNLVAKEYVASRTNQTGVLILSEMAGAAQEMGEAMIINPTNEEEIAESIYKALSMPLKEQYENITLLQERIKRYDVFKWAGEFVNGIKKIIKIQKNFLASKITPEIKIRIIESYKKSKRREIFLDYDGTLTSYRINPSQAKPDDQLYMLIKRLAEDPANSVTIISGRDRKTMEKWFMDYKVNLIVEHGIWLKNYGKKWQTLANTNNSWKTEIRPLLESYVDRTPRSFLEEKNYSLVWHFRSSEPEQGELRANELKEELYTLTANLNLEVMEGNKVIEVKTGGINKGLAAHMFLQNKQFDFILAMGDDWTDEYMYSELAGKAITIQVGLKHTSAMYKLESVAAARNFLYQLTE